MIKTWKREELTNLSQEAFAALSPEEQLEVKRQGRAFLVADLNQK
jgi:hypothetical protein